MAYLRFLTYKDYLAIATEEHLKQLVRDVPERFAQAEQRAEQNMREYLDQYYEIEKVLAVGKNIREYNPAVSYPSQVFFKKDDNIYRTLTCINGYKCPTKTVYWRHITEMITPCLTEKARKYSQLRTWAKGDIVVFGTEYWECIVPHGYEGNNIHIPGVEAWKEAEVTPWEPNLEWKKNNVCSFEGNFYVYLKDKEKEIEDLDEEAAEEPIEAMSEEQVDVPEPTPDDVVKTPEEDDDWGLIGDYSLDLEYDYAEGAFDYVVAEGTVFYPVLNPNADALNEGGNITHDDPRNDNIKAHMCNIALYYMHQLISPTNISETRKWAFEESMQWLYNASKFKINPQLPRKRSCEDGEKKVDWALATFQKSYNPNENAWLI